MSEICMGRGSSTCSREQSPGQIANLNPIPFIALWTTKLDNIRVATDWPCRRQPDAFLGCLNAVGMVFSLGSNNRAKQSSGYAKFRNRCRSSLRQLGSDRT